MGIPNQEDSDSWRFKSLLLKVLPRRKHKFAGRVEKTSPGNKDILVLLWDLQPACAACACGTRQHQANRVIMFESTKPWEFTASRTATKNTFYINAGLWEGPIPLVNRACSEADSESDRPWMRRASFDTLQFNGWPFGDFSSTCHSSSPKWGDFTLKYPEIKDSWFWQKHVPKPIKMAPRSFSFQGMSTAQKRALVYLKSSHLFLLQKKTYCKLNFSSPLLFWRRFQRFLPSWFVPSNEISFLQHTRCLRPPRNAFDAPVR